MRANRRVSAWSSRVGSHVRRCARRVGRRASAPVRFCWQHLDLTISLLVGASLAILSYPIQQLLFFDSRPDYVEAGGTRVVVMNRRGEVIRRVPVKSEIAVAKLLKEENLIVVGTNRFRKGPELSLPPDMSEFPGHVMLYDTRGRQLWDFDSYDETMMDSLDMRGVAHSDRFAVRQLEVSDLDGDGRKEIVALCGDPTWFVTRLVVLTLDRPQDGGTTKVPNGDFWHPGQIEYFTIANADADSASQILCHGLNNDLPYWLKDWGWGPGQLAAVAFVLDGDAPSGGGAGKRFSGVDGQAPPACLPRTGGAERVAAPVWYWVIPPGDTRIHRTIVEGPSGAESFVMATEDGRFYVADAEGALVGTKVTTHWTQQRGHEPFLCPLRVRREDSRLMVEVVESDRAECEASHPRE